MLLIENIYLTDHNNDVIETATIQITIFSQFAVEIGKTIDEYTTKSESKSMKIYKLRIIEVFFASNKRRFAGWHNVFQFHPLLIIRYFLKEFQGKSLRCLFQYRV